MPRTPSLFSIRHNTTIILVDSNLNMIEGGLRHVDRSTTISNRDAFNIENTVTDQQLPPTASLVVGNDGMVVFLGLEASRALIYNGLIQCQPPWYLQIPPPHVKHTIQTELHVRDKFFRYTSGIGTYNFYVYARYAF